MPRLSAEEWSERVSTAVSPESWAEPFLRYTQPGQSILELGCAGGGLTQLLAGRKVTGLDFSQAALAANVYCSSTVKADVLGDWAVPDNSHDWVISSGLLEHFNPTELMDILYKSARVARIGVMAEVPNAGCKEYMDWKRLKEIEGEWEYGDEFPKKSLLAQFRRAGLKKIEESSVDHDSFGSKVGYLLVTRGLV